MDNAIIDALMSHSSRKESNAEITNFTKIIQCYVLDFKSDSILNKFAFEVNK